MAVEHASELASIVTSYLRKHGFMKTLSAFLRENGDAGQDRDVADLETLHELYISTQANGTSIAKKPRRTKSESGSASLDKDVIIDGENAYGSLQTNGGISSEKKKKKTVDKKNASVDIPLLEQTAKHADAAEGKETKKEEGSKKKKRGENIESSYTNIEGLKSEREKAFSNGNGAQNDSTLEENVTEDHEADGGCLAHSRNLSSKKSKKEKKKQGCLYLHGKEAFERQHEILQDKSISAATEARPADNAQVLSQNVGTPKKKKKKSKDFGFKEGKGDAAVTNSASEEVICENASKQPVITMKHLTESVNEFEGLEISAKKKRHRKELSLHCPEGGLKEPSKSELEEMQNDDTDSVKHSSKKRKVKENLDAGKDTNQDSSNGSSAEKLKEVREVADKEVEMHNAVAVKAKREKDTPNNEKTPTGALAFKRVEVEKVTFSDPRLGDNSYWAKDGAEEGYGAKAQEVLGLVRGRDFRHEKTKKKRGSYRGGIIGLQSHSIKFENSDED